MDPIRKQTPYPNRSFASADTSDLLVITDREMINKMPIQDGMKILDVGAGSGRDLVLILDQFPSCICMGIDLVPRNNAPYSIDAGNSMSLPYSNQAFDIAYANGLFGDLLDAEVALTLLEMKRVAKQVYYTEIYDDLSIGFFIG